MSMTHIQRERLVEEARMLVGVPFQHAGRNAYGLDCVGLLVVATRNADMDVYDNAAYSPVVDSDYMLAELEHAATPLPIEEPLRPGDVLLFKVGRHPQHLGLVSAAPGDGSIWVIHAYQTVGKVVETRLDVTWLSRIVGRYEWRPS